MATTWTVEFLPEAVRDLRQVKVEVNERVFHSILQSVTDLSEDATPPDSTHLRRTKDHYRLRVEGNYRAIYRIAFGRRRVLIVSIRPRGIAYRKWLKWGRDRTNP